ncbi:type VI secretion system tip protein VgrG [Acinetobacter sp. 194]|uniref:type VI secretion system Vgr family protein n=1 Tax=Acinetobacter shaoyimingii TaxID=2715164 RepID=UPI001408F221|nr:type VI secretion system Vgr family protein [Acinetobacter shaoyimingii]NHB57550.1 type VI secretion system tip protein VgrG [Acinetobacter shaoyimingii]
MLNNIYGVLEKLGFGGHNRVIHIQFSNEDLNKQVFLQYINGSHKINEGLSVDLICLSTNPYISLKAFIGCQVAVDQITDTGKIFRTTGIVTGASQGQSDGALSLYRLTLQDATSLWHKRRNSRVFMNKTAVEIIETIFQEWQSKSPLFAASLKLDTDGLTQHYDVRPFSMQSNESDYVYLTRLMREEGINWLIDESDYLVDHFQENIAQQKLRLIDDNHQFETLQRRVIRYHRSHATEKYDSITSLIAQRQLQPTSIYVQRWQADVLNQEDASGAVLSSHQHSQQRDNESLGLEQAWNVSPAWIRDLNGEDQSTASSNHQLEKLNHQLNAYQALQAKYFKVMSSVRDVQVGYWFQLIDHPELDQNHQGTDKEFLILSKQFYNQNNLPKDIQDQLEKLLDMSQWHLPKLKSDERQANELIVIRREIAVVPEYDPLIHRAVAHVQRAKVVGGETEEIHVDEWGRIKVRFLFTRADDHVHDGGAGSNDNDTDSAWVDVLTPWAGEGYGARFLPRVGEIVVIDFFDGNIDRPFVTGRIHEAQRSPTKFDIKGRLPDTKKLSGIRSKEVAGEGFNQLRFDDTTGQISTQLQSSHASTQLNLGNLSHPKELAESEARGQGFELRTDQSGAIRSQNLYLTTFVQDKAASTQLEAKEATGNFAEGLQNMKALSEYATKQQAEAADMLNNIADYIQKVESQWSDLQATKDALMLLASPDSIGLTAAKDIHVNALNSLTLGSGNSTNLSTDEHFIVNAKKKMSLFAGEEDFKLYAAKGKLDVQAQDNELNLSARTEVKISSSDGKVEINSPTEIVLKAKNSAIRIDGNGVTVITPNQFTAKAAQHIFTSGASETPILPLFPNNICWECLARRAAQRGAFVNKGGAF